MANGNAYDNLGRLVSCEHATSRVTRTEKDGEIKILASHFEGKELNSPNDIIVSEKGAIYFTDPTFGRMEYYGVLRECELEVRGVYMIDNDGQLSLLADDFDQPNGLCFSDDESKLFVNDSMKNHIRVFDINADGTLKGGSVWATLESDGEGVADGMKIDTAGNMYCCGPGGIHILDSNAKSLGVIEIPEAAANFTWGESDMKSLFITASSSLYKLRVKIPGRLAY
jgi:gluconolactonase